MEDKEEFGVALISFVTMTFGIVCTLAAIGISFPALLCAIAGCIWFVGAVNHNRLLKSFSYIAGALSIGFAIFIFLYIFLYHRSYEDEISLNTMSEYLWHIETILINIRLFLKNFLGNTWWLLAYLLTVIVLALLSPLIGSYGLVSKFRKLQVWLSRLAFALIAATTFSVFLSTDYGNVVGLAHQAVLRRSVENTSRMLAGEIVKSAAQQFSAPQQHFYQVFLSELGKHNANVVRTIIRQEVEVSPKTTGALEEWVSVHRSELVYAAANHVEDRDTLSAARGLFRAEEEKREAKEAVIATLFTKGISVSIERISNLNNAVEVFVDVLVEMIAEPFATALTRALDGNWTIGKRIKLLSETLKAKIDWRSTGDIIQMKGFSALSPAGGEVGSDRIIAYIEKAVANAEPKITRGKPPVDLRPRFDGAGVSQGGRTETDRHLPSSELRREPIRGLHR